MRLLHPSLHLSASLPCLREPITSTFCSGSYHLPSQSSRQQPMTRFLLALALFLASFPSVASDFACTSTQECEIFLRAGSDCINGYCTNPFYKRGCLATLLPEWNKTRICNSQDPPEAEALGYCRQSPMDYTEVRISGANWESFNLEAWVLQLILSEVLDVPTSIEGGYPELNLNFYEKNSAFDFGSTTVDHDRVPEFVVAQRVLDCRETTTNIHDYEACYHLIPEMWWEGFTEDTKNSLPGMEPVQELGMTGENSLFVPLFAATNDTSLVSWLGLRGEQNRRKMAETFKTPTRWKHFCEEESPTRCTQPDPIAARAPETDEEEEAFYVEGLYNGFFRATEESNCDKYPTTCKGHVAEYPCSWTTILKQQLHHLDIALESRGDLPNGGYVYTELYQMWKAANATRSPIIMKWWQPEPLYEEFVTTEAEFTRVLLPAPTQECFDHRVKHELQCDPNATFFELFGSPEGACDTLPQVLQKGISVALEQISKDPSTHEEFWSPAYDVIFSYKMSNLNLGQIFKYWQQRGTDYWNFDPRDAVCQWVSENLDTVRAFIPEAHPRVVKENLNSQVGLFQAAVAFAVIALSLVFLSVILSFMKRKTKVFYYTQPDFLFQLLFGMLLVTLGALLLAVPPSSGSCASVTWFLNIGFVLQLVPLFTRILAINRLATAGKQMQRVRLKPIKLYAYTAIGLFIIGAFVLTWTIVDAPERLHSYELTNLMTSEGEAIVHAFPYCGSRKFDFWYLVLLGWMALILIPACLVAMLASRVKEDMNDTRSMSMVLYSHFFFLVLLISAFLSLYNSNEQTLMGIGSILLSIQTIVALGLYVVPKFRDSGDCFDEEPLPDVFVNTTIALIDVVGFTAWSSVREPVQIFQFLEKLYEHIDKIADRHKVYKVETVGERYVAATGIPNAQSDHAVIMARFAARCMKKMPKFVKRMEVQFGPDTGDLSLMMGLHSGPVTGGFLKGKGARFQLFGDTLNTANLMLRTGMSDRIHLSETTAGMLIKCGRKKWVLEREDKVQTLEKGKMTTYFLVKGNLHGSLSYEVSSFHGSSVVDSDSDDDEELEFLESEERWIEWNVDIFKTLLKHIVAGRVRGSSAEFKGKMNLVSDGAEMPLEAVKEIISLPEFDRKATKRQHENLDEVVLPQAVIAELREYIMEIAGLYNPNPFHNFAHASYVVMAVTKYMNRIIAASEANLGEDRFRSSVRAALHNHTFGITSDPLTQFACVFSALIHDADHPGVPNPQLIKEDEEVAYRYKGRSVAEQKSLDLSWDLLMEERFANLRGAICHSPEELQRLRQLVINSVMATDLGDKELKALRNGRWEKAFAGSESSTEFLSSEADEEAQSKQESKTDRVNRKATIVIEHLIQAADVAHMSQHWHIYRKWNERLFRETYKAWREGRAASNPAENWYKGEIGFFDFYIIPLSKKLRDCGVFGPTSDENLNYATNNRNLWEQEGESIVEEMLFRAEGEFGKEAETAPRMGNAGL